MIPLHALAAPDGPEEFTVYTVTPGLAGFFAFLILALAGWLLFRSLSRHIRRVDRNARLRQQEESGEAVTGQQPAAPRPSDPSTSPDQAPR